MRANTCPARTLSPSRTTKSINSPATRALITALLTALMLPVKGTPTVKARLLRVITSPEASS